MSEVLQARERTRGCIISLLDLDSSCSMKAILSALVSIGLGIAGRTTDLARP